MMVSPSDMGRVAIPAFVQGKIVLLDQRWSTTAVDLVDVPDQDINTSKNGAQSEKEQSEKTSILQSGLSSSMHLCGGYTHR